jgi:hypothetical protein
MTNKLCAKTLRLETLRAFRGSLWNCLLEVFSALLGHGYHAGDNDKKYRKAQTAIFSADHFDQYCENWSTYP